MNPFFTLPQNLLFHVIKVLWHFPSPGFREEQGQEPGGDGHHGEDEGGDGGVDVSQGGHSGGQRPAHFGHQRGGAHASSTHCRGHQLA